MRTGGGIAVQLHKAMVSSLERADVIASIYELRLNSDLHQSGSTCINARQNPKSQSRLVRSACLALWAGRPSPVALMGQRPAWFRCSPNSKFHQNAVAIYLSNIYIYIYVCIYIYILYIYIYIYIHMQYMQYMHRSTVSDMTHTALTVPIRAGSKGQRYAMSLRFRACGTQPSAVTGMDV